MVALLTLTEVTQRSGVSASALRFYEARGLISATRSSTNRRTYRRGVLRRLAVIRAAQAVGLSLGDVAEALAPFPVEATLNARQWARVAEDWQTKLTLRIEALTELRDGLEGCIGCGCLSMIDCPLYNPDDHLSAQGPGPRRMPAVTALAREGTALATKSTREPPPVPQITRRHRRPRPRHDPRYARVPARLGPELVHWKLQDDDGSAGLTRRFV